MAISKKLRFEVFKRDEFTCQYCGKTPPSVTLEIDHVIPKSKKGSDDINNLITSCFDCNRGKSNIPLKKIPNSLKENYDILKEKENQYREYQKLLLSIEKRCMKEADEINNIYNSMNPGYVLSENFIKSSVYYFLKKLGADEVKQAMRIACDRVYNSDKCIKYFCGICWNKIKGI